MASKFGRDVEEAVNGFKANARSTNMSEVLGKPTTVKHEAAKRCPYYDDDCKYVQDYVGCWSGEHTDDPFPGYCPFVFGRDR